MRDVARARWLPWVAALVAPMLSCTLLVQFHDQSADVGDASADVAPPREAGSDAPEPVDAAEAAVVDTYAPCAAKKNGWYCGNNGLADVLPDADLVYCSNGVIGSLTVCDAGCLHVVDPFPDSCNPCGGAANGNYCGRDFGGFNTDNADILITCTGGQTSDQDACIHGCGSNGKMSACYP